MSKIITKIKKLWQRFGDKEYRDAYVAANISDSLAGQIYAMREARGWTQGQLAKKADMVQPRISLLEESCEGVSVSTLKKLASAFDVGLTIEFVRFSKIVESAALDRLDRPVISFVNDSVPDEGRQLSSCFVVGSPGNKIIVSDQSRPLKTVISTHMSGSIIRSYVAKASNIKAVERVNV